jgi:hypothetical protein
LGGRPVAFVAASSTMVAIIYITFGVLGRTFLMSAATAIFIVIIIVVYFIGAAKLSAAIGNGNEAGVARGEAEKSEVRVVALTRRVAVVLSIYVVVVGAYTVLSGSGHHVLLPLQMIMTNLLMPVLMSAALLLLIRFIRDSFTRQQTRIAIREARKKKGTKSNASVSPATEFKESSMATKGRSTTTDV